MILSSVVCVIRSAGVTRWRKAITRMAPSDVKQSFLTPSLKLTVYLIFLFEEERGTYLLYSSANSR